MSSRRRAERGAIGLVLMAGALVVILLTMAVGAVAQYLGAYLQASSAADAAALAAAPVTFSPFGAEGTPTQEAARFARANGVWLRWCRCPVDESWEPRTVEVEVERTVRVILFGERTVRARSRAEFVPALLLGAQ